MIEVAGDHNPDIDPFAADLLHNESLRRDAYHDFQPRGNIRRDCRECSSQQENRRRYGKPKMRRREDAKMRSDHGVSVLSVMPFRCVILHSIFFSCKKQLHSLLKCFDSFMISGFRIETGT
jgi:hypothetical protein